MNQIVFMALMRCLPPETAHRLSIGALAALSGRGKPVADDPLLERILPNSRLRWSNPVGLAAGFDKDAQAVAALSSGRGGFGFVECGTVTPRPQSGNAGPRLFRLPAAGALINRLGFPGQGLEPFAARLEALSPEQRNIVGVNIGANADSSDFIEDYVIGARRLAPLCAYLAVNISSPNTKGLRELQRPDLLLKLLEQINRALSGQSCPVFLKIAPDIADADIAAIVELARATACVRGMIVANTSIARPEGLGQHSAEPGGLSGKPILASSTALLGKIAKAAQGELDLIGVGGVHDLDSALDKFRAGAHAIQLYTALVFSGPGLVKQIKQGLIKHLQQNGMSSLSELSDQISA